MKGLTIPKAISFYPEGIITARKPITEQAWQGTFGPVIKDNKEIDIFSIRCDYSGKGLPTDSPVVPDTIINDIKEILILLNIK